MCTFNPSIEEAEAGGSLEFKASLFYRVILGLSGLNREAMS